MRSFAAILTRALCLGLLALAFIPQQVSGAEKSAQLSTPNRSTPARQFGATGSTIETQSVASPHPRRANFEQEHKSRDAQKVADWVVDSGDNSGMPFVIVDKKDAKVFIFDADGLLRGAAPALLGLSKGDDAVPGIGDRPLSTIRPDERTTPAGRFVAALGYNFNGKDVLWVDYEGAVSMHRVVTSNPKERRLERLATPTPLDNRISFGCINVPANFFDKVLIPTLTGTYCVVYVLPETRSISETFSSFHDIGTTTTADIEEPSKLGPHKASLKQKLQGNVEEHKSR